MSKHKEKKAAPQSAEIRAGQSAAAKPFALEKPWLVVLYGLLFGLFISYATEGTIKVLTFLCTLAVIVILILRTAALRAQVTWLFASVSLMVIFGGISTLYAAAPKFALLEFLKVLLAFCCFLTVLAFAGNRGMQRGCKVAYILAGASALISFVSIDLLSTHLFSDAFSALSQLVGAGYRNIIGIEVGVRMVGIFGNANVLAGIIGIGVLLSLGLVSAAEQRTDRRIALCLLAVNSLGFVLAFSMGATATILIAFLVYLLLEQKGKRIKALFLMVETLVLTLLATFPIYLTAFKTWEKMQPVPLVCLLVLCAALCLLDEKVGQKLAARYADSGKSVFLPLGIILGLFAAYLVLAVSITGDLSVSDGTSCDRIIALESGDYTLSLDADYDMHIRVSAQNREDTMMHTKTILYEGKASEARFTVPEDSLSVRFKISADAGDLTIRELSYDGTESGKVKLGYPLLPGFIANRLQGLWANQNAIQRTVFFEDGLRMFRRSPIIGRGLGYFESALGSVQDFYYQTKYAHNHYIQSMADTGIIGLLLFVSTLVFSFWSVLRRRKSEDAPVLLAALGSALTFMACHAAVEVVFSFFSYLPMAYGVFALINLTCGDALPAFPVKQDARPWLIRAIALLLAAYALLLGNNLRAKSYAQEGSYQMLDKAAAIDCFDWADYALSYSYGILTSDQELPDEAYTTAHAYLKKLEKIDSNTIPLYLAEVYFKLGQTEDAFRMLQKYTSYVASDSEAWQKAFDLTKSYYAKDEVYLNGLCELYQSMKDWNETHMGEVSVDDNTLFVLNSIESMLQK